MKKMDTKKDLVHFWCFFIKSEESFPFIFLDNLHLISFIFQRKRGLDVNRYATKKTIAQGMLDVALLTANASQLKYVLQLGEDKHDFYYLMLALIILSIILQVNII